MENQVQVEPQITVPVEPKPKKNLWIILGIVLGVVIIVLVILGLWKFYSKKDEPNVIENSQQTSNVPKDENVILEENTPVDEFEVRLIDFLYTQFPESKQEPVADMKKIAHEEVLNAKKYGLETEQQIATYFLTAWLLGEHFDTDFPAAKQMLNSSASADAKAQWLEDWTTKMFEALEQ